MVFQFSDQQNLGKLLWKIYSFRKSWWNKVYNGKRWWKDILKIWQMPFWYWFSFSHSRFDFSLQKFHVKNSIKWMEKSLWRNRTIAKERGLFLLKPFNISLHPVKHDKCLIDIRLVHDFIKKDSGSTKVFTSWIDKHDW